MRFDRIYDWDEASHLPEVAAQPPIIRALGILGGRAEEERTIQEFVRQQVRTRPFVEQLAEIDPSVKFLTSDLFQMVGESTIQTTVRQQGVINALRQKARRFQNEKHNKAQSLHSMKLRLEEAYEDLAAMRQERDEAKKGLDHYRSMCETLAIELEER